jgi:hypothetical protein
LGVFLNGTIPVHVITLDAGPGQRSSRTCAAITTLNPTPPLTIVSFGDAALLLPAVAVAQRAAHRRVVEYVLVDPQLPDVTESWPDARVRVFCEATSEAAIPSRLRGWDVEPLSGLPDWLPSVD